jgi:hypothetical protein
MPDSWLDMCLIVYESLLTHCPAGLAQRKKLKLYGYSIKASQGKENANGLLEDGRTDMAGNRESLSQALKKPFIKKNHF